jgi:hypothetical protein
MISGYIQLGLVALAFGGLQVWWIRSTTPAFVTTRLVSAFT